MSQLFVIQQNVEEQTKSCTQCACLIGNFDIVIMVKMLSLENSDWQRNSWEVARWNGNNVWDFVRLNANTFRCIGRENASENDNNGWYCYRNSWYNSFSSMSWHSQTQLTKTTANARFQSDARGGWKSFVHRFFILACALKKAKKQTERRCM